MLARSEIDRALDRLELDYLETLADRVTMPSPASRTLAKRLEKVEKGIVFSQDSEELTNTIEVFSDTFESKAEARTTLIPKPPGECGRGRNSKKKGYHLRRAMGLSGKKELYNRIRVCVLQWSFFGFADAYMHARGSNDRLPVFIWLDNRTMCDSRYMLME